VLRRRLSSSAARWEVGVSWAEGAEVVEGGVIVVVVVVEIGEGRWGWGWVGKGLWAKVRGVVVVV